MRARRNVVIEGENTFDPGKGGGDQTQTAYVAAPPPAVRYQYGYDGKDDFILGDGRSDYIFGRSGNDFLSGGVGNDVLWGEDGNDVLFGGENNDSLIGGSGNDVLYDTSGANTLVGGLNEDTFYISSADNYVSGGGGDDTVILVQVQQFDLRSVVGRFSGVDRFILHKAVLNVTADSVTSATDNKLLLVNSGTVTSSDSTPWVFEGFRFYDGREYNIYSHLNTQGNRVELALSKEVNHSFGHVLDLGTSHSVTRIDGVPLPNAAGRPPIQQDKTNTDPQLADWSTQTGFSVAGVGDFNGDGYSDVIFGAPWQGFRAPDGSYVDTAGAAYILYGSKQGIAPVDLAQPLGQRGIRIFGDHAGANAGFSVNSAGDLNGDGISDVIVGSPLGGNGNGAAHVIYGQRGGYADNTDIYLSDLRNGYRIIGPVVTNQDRIIDFAGGVSSAGDVNGDGVNDLLIGAVFIDNGQRVDVGEAYLIFGSRTGYASIDVSTFREPNYDGRLGVRFIGVSARDRTGTAATGIGDVNGDGYNDIAISAPQADNNGLRSGSIYVLFGSRTGFGNNGTVDLAHLSLGQGLRIDGQTSPLGPTVVGGRLGISVASIGDVNGDGIADFVAGADRQDANSIREAGGAFVFYGNRNLSQSLTLDLNHFDASQGVHIVGALERDRVGYSVSSAGDFNRDGIADLIIGSAFVDANGGVANGASYLIYGHKGGIGGPNGVLNLADLLPSQGFKITGAVGGEQAGVVSRAGDVNGDGYEDLIVGAYSASHSGSGAGSVYIIYGGATPDHL